MKFFLIPRSNAHDYTEYYNKSNKIFDASKLFIANRNSSNVISSIKPLSASPSLLFSEDYITITVDADRLSRADLVKNPRLILLQSSLPSMPADKGLSIV